MVFRFKVWYWIDETIQDDVEIEQGYVIADTMDEAYNRITEYFGEENILELRLKFKDECPLVLGVLSNDVIDWRD